MEWQEGKTKKLRRQEEKKQEEQPKNLQVVELALDRSYR
jgi:hypothetical protein